ncbi:hypothetical protein N7470_004949 [Penicillium chermesinum]|nr:hypothetical protein N7470_004949 [Penicillium chermesinum]
MPMPRVPSQLPSPSVYSERSGGTPEPNPHYPYPSRHRSFSLPGNAQQQSRPLTSGSHSSTSSVDLSATPRISIAADNASGNSFTSTSSTAVPSMPAIPSLQPRRPPQTRRSSGTLAPSNGQPTGDRRISVSPIPEERSSASSRGQLAPVSWGSEQAESEILGAYLDDSGDERSVDHDNRASSNEAALLRNASLGKRQKPTVRTITKSNPSSEVSLVQPSPLNIQGQGQDAAAGAAVSMSPRDQLRENTQPSQPSPLSRASSSSQSGESYVDPAKPRIAKPTDEENRAAWEKEMGLPAPAPTMSDKRPGARKPPKLDLGAVRNAEQRSSLSSMTDLIRRATKLATNLEHGRTASKGNVLDNVAQKTDSRERLGLGVRERNSGSLSDILASFPNPSMITPDVRSSWPVFFNRSHSSNLRGEPLGSYDETAPHEKKPTQRKCCGIPRKWFIILCIILFIVVVLAILLPVFLVAVPKEKASDSSCATKNPCKNGGVSVSAGSECSCVCAGGFIGAQCTVQGDSSCVTSAIDQGSVNSNATMGSSLPTVFDQSQSKFNISLSPVTIMALFSMNNISCPTENALVAFSKVDIEDSSKRSVAYLEDREFQYESLPPSSTEADTSSVALVPRAVETSNGIVFEGGAENGPSGGTSTSDDTTSSGTATTSTTQGTGASHSTATAVSTSTAAAAPATSTNSRVPLEVVEFSKAVVLLVLQRTGSFSSALYSETEIETYLVDSYPSAAHPSMDVLGLFSLDFENKTLTVK